MAQTTWALSGGGDWNVNSNWSGGVFPNAAGASAVFGASITNQSTISNSGPITIGSLRISNTNQVSLGWFGSTIAFATTSGPATIDVNARVRNGVAHFILANVVLNTNLVVTDSVSTLTRPFVFNTGITGSGSLTKEGSGVLGTRGLFNTGGVNLNDGTIMADGELPSTGLVSVGDGTGAAGSAVLRIQTSGRGFSAAINTDGLIEVRATAVTNTAISGIGQIWIETNAFRSITFTGTNTQTYSGIITGGLAATNAPDPTAGRLQKTGTNTLILAGANTYASRTFIDSGAIRAASSTALGAAGSSNATYIHNTGALELTNSLSISEPLFLNGQGNGQGALRSVSGSNTVTGPVAIGWAGTGVTASNASLGAAAGSTLVMGTAITSTNAAIGLTKYGTGTVIFQGDNTYTGDTVVGQGTLRLEGAGLIADGSHLVVSNAATMQLNDISDTVRGVSGAGNVSLGSATLTLSNTATNHSFSGVVSGTGAIIKSGTGTQTFGGANTYTGATTVAGGTLAAGNGALGGTTNVAVNAGATLLLSSSGAVNDAATVTLSGGTIQRGSGGVSETTGNLSLTADSFLNYGTGQIGTLTFGTYSPTFKLTVNNFLEGNVLRFTSNLSDNINTASLFAFDNGFVYDWDATTPGFFTITAIPEPSTYAAAAGLVGLLLWPARRRIIKDTQRILGLRHPMRDRLERLRAGSD